jgi:16S rRNA (adenine1518-N6/adenine1519-N6)-dimethyltransferase
MDGPRAEAIAGLPPLRETIATHGLDARKRLGQHFLLDLNLTRRIARAAAPLVEGTVIEVGPGPGGLTRALLLEGAVHVIAIEVDPRAIGALRELQAAAAGRLDIIEADALSIDPVAIGASPRRIVANLPYNVSTALLIRWLHTANDIADMVLMFQKEVVDRLAAVPRSKDYGRLSVLTQHVCEVRRLFDVAPSAFVPPPKVTSAVARLTPRPAERRLADLRPLEKVTAAAFGQRRKMLRGSLLGLFPDPTRVLESLGLSPTARAEELSVADFVRLAGALDDDGPSDPRAGPSQRPRGRTDVRA